MKLFKSVFSLAICMLTIAATSVWGAETATISVTVSLESVIAVSVEPNNWAINMITLGSSTEPQDFTATIGNTATKIEIKASNANSGWVLSDIPAQDSFNVSILDPDLDLSTVYQELGGSIPAYGQKNFSMVYTAPVSDTKGGGVDQSFNVTLKASAP